MIERTIAAASHGRYLVEPTSNPDARLLLVGFHGYGERAEIQMERLRAIPGSDRWVLLAVQGLHQFYRGRSHDVVASWMTRQDRELTIADNTAYVANVVNQVASEWRTRPIVVYVGFFQGVAMAYRAASALARTTAGVVSLGGDVPPELDRASLAHVRAALVGRGQHDEWYSAKVADADIERLRDAGAEVRSVVLEAAHEWTPEFSAATGDFLNRWSRPSA